MTYKRLTSTMVEIDGDFYIKYEFRGDGVSDVKSSICALLRKNGEMTEGVLVNRCRKWRVDDVKSAIRELMSDATINARSSVHARSMVPVFYYSMNKK